MHLGHPGSGCVQRRSAMAPEHQHQRAMATYTLRINTKLCTTMPLGISRSEDSSSELFNHIRITSRSLEPRLVAGWTRYR